MDIHIHPRPLSGSLPAVASKSDAHRLLICAALSDGVTRLYVPERSVDIDATASCLISLGADIAYDGEAFTVRPIEKVNTGALLDCRESGSTLRFLLPVAAALGTNATLTGSGKLPQRPIGELLAAMRENGVGFSSDTLPLKLSGKLQSGVYELPGNVSSQYVTGLLLALPISGGGEIRLTSRLESSGYVDMTISTMRRFGVTVEATPDGWRVPAAKYRSPGVIRAEGDYSNAAFFLTAGAISGEVTVTNLAADSVQGDRRIADILRSFGVEVTVNDGAVTVKSAALHGTTVDLANVPDLLPILAVAAAFSEGETRFINGARLRIKESDRLASVAAMLRSFGIDVTEAPDGLTVRGGTLTPGTVDGANDHRIVMAASVAASLGKGGTITGAEAVNKSYPTFFDDLKKLGGEANVV